MNLKKITLSQTKGTFHVIPLIHKILEDANSFIETERSLTAWGRAGGGGDSRKQSLPRAPWVSGLGMAATSWFKIWFPMFTPLSEHHILHFKCMQFTVCRWYFHEAFLKVGIKKVRVIISLILFPSRYLNVLFHMLGKLGEHVIARVIAAMTIMPFGTLGHVWCLNKPL